MGMVSQKPRGTAHISCLRSLFISAELNNDYVLIFNYNGMMELAEDTGDIPTVTFNFVCVSDLASQAPRW